MFENTLLERKLIYLAANYFGSGFNEPSTVKDKEDNNAFSLSVCLSLSAKAMDKYHVSKYHVDKYQVSQILNKRICVKNGLWGQTIICVCIPLF